MDSSPLNTRTAKQLSDYLAKPSQSVGIIGQKWLNKAKISRHIAKQLLAIDDHALDNYPYILRLESTDTKSIGIDKIRQINGFISLKVPTNKAINRIISIDDAQLMTIEAQNALLKGLEEPPLGTIFILSSTSISESLPTIMSRLQPITVLKPSKASLESYYEHQGHEKAAIAQAYLISGGLPGLMDLLLGDDEHPLNLAVKQSRQLLSGTTFDRLNLVNELAKDKQELKNVFFILKQMATIGLTSADQPNLVRWQKILSAIVKSEASLTNNAQTKLLLTDFMLSIA